MDEEEKNLYIERKLDALYQIGIKKSVRFLSRGSASLADPLRISESECLNSMPEPGENERYDMVRLGTEEDVKEASPERKSPVIEDDVMRTNEEAYLGVFDDMKAFFEQFA